MTRFKDMFVPLAAIAAMCWGVASASATPGPTLDINGWAANPPDKENPEGEKTIWGTHAGGPPLPFFPNDPKLSKTVYYDIENPEWFVIVWAGEIPQEHLPKNKKFGGWIMFDFSGFAPGRFKMHEIEIPGIKAPEDEDNYINGVWIERAMPAPFDPTKPYQHRSPTPPGKAYVINNSTGIRWDSSGAELAANPHFVIYWTQRELPEGGKKIMGLLDTWLDTLNNGGPAAAMTALYHQDASLLPTLGNYHLYTNLPRNAMNQQLPIIHNYFEFKFLPLNPEGVVTAQHIIVSDDMASNQGLYTFTVNDNMGGRTKKKARFTFVYIKDDVGDWKIIHHHSSADATQAKPDDPPPCRADLDNDNLVGSKDLAILLGFWGPCP